MDARVLVLLVALSTVFSGPALGQTPPPPPSPPSAPSSDNVSPPTSFDATPSGVPDPIIRPAGPNDVFRAGPRTYAPRYTPRFDRPAGRSDRRLRFPYSYGVVGGYLPYYGDERERELQPPAEGRLSLRVTPLSAQVYVDGFYRGVVGDFQDRGLWLEAGPRRIELREDGYESATFDVRIDEERTVDYRRDLAPLIARADPPRVPATPKTFYVIPGCYAGTSKPDGSRLPAGCSARNVKEIPPTVQVVSSKFKGNK